jgi:hypothetical protein
MLKRDYVGKRVRLRREFRTRGGSLYAAGTHWNVSSTHRGRFCLRLCEDAELPLHRQRVIRQVRVDDFEVFE